MDKNLSKHVDLTKVFTTPVLKRPKKQPMDQSSPTETENPTCRQGLVAKAKATASGLFAPTPEQTKAIKAGRGFCERCGNTYTDEISCGCRREQ